MVYVISESRKTNLKKGCKIYKHTSYLTPFVKPQTKHSLPAFKAQLNITYPEINFTEIEYIPILDKYNLQMLRLNESLIKSLREKENEKHSLIDTGLRALKNITSFELPKFDFTFGIGDYFKDLFIEIAVYLLIIIIVIGLLKCLFKKYFNC